jgi:subtilisin family serine protease
MKHGIKPFRVLFPAILACSLLAVASHGRMYTGQDQPKPYVIPGRVTIQLEDNVDVQGFTKGFGKVSLGVPSLDQLLDNFGIFNARKLFPWHKVKPSYNPPDLDPSRLFDISFPDTIDVEAVIAALLQNPNIRRAEPVWALPLLASPNDPMWSNQWAMEPPGPDPDYYDAWDIETGSDSIKFGCIDSGVNYKHEDLKGHIWVNPGEDLDGDGVVYDVDDLNNVDDDGNGVIDDLIGYDFLTGLGSCAPGEDCDTRDPDPWDFHGHGTHVAGIAAAMNNNAIGVTGVAGGWHGGHRSFRGVQIMCIRVGGRAADGLGYVNSSDCGTAISYASLNGAQVINASWGSSYNSAMNQGMIDAKNHGVTVVHAAGNDNCDCPDYLDGDPQGHKVLSVAALGPFSDTKASYSNYGAWIDVSAPGSHILSTVSEGGVAGYAYYDGTSMAAPMVSGLALLIRSAMPSLTKQQVDSLIINTADNIDAANPGYVGMLGSGRINAHSALVDLPSAKFAADVTEGNVPLLVNFTDMSPNSPSSWLWRFGTGDSSTQQDPQYTYADKGVYSVSLLIDDGNPLGLGEEHLKHYIWARADTCVLDSVEAELGSKVVMPVYLANTALINQIQFAFSFPNTNGVSWDSFSTAGLRTDYFYSVAYNAFDPANKRFSILMRSSHPDSSHYLSRDTGAILNLYFNVSSGGSLGVVTVDTATVNAKAPKITAIWGDYWPVFTPGKIVIVPAGCCNGDGIRGDVNGSGTISIPDVTYLVAYLKGIGDPPECEEEGDVNGSGSINVTDVTHLVAYLKGIGPPPADCP